MIIKDIKKNIMRLKTALPEGKSFKKVLEIDILADDFPPSNLQNKKTNNVIYAIHNNKESLGYMDLTGRFPYQSSRGSNYIMVAYHYDGNVILIQPLKNRETKTIVKAWAIINNKLAGAGAQLNTYIIENKCSADLKAAFGKNNITFQQVPPHYHQANLAERAIKTTKGHSKSSCTSVDIDFPIQEWD